MMWDSRGAGRWALGGVLAVASAACGAQATEGAGGQSGGMGSSTAGGSKASPAGGSVSMGGSGKTGGASSGSGAATGGSQNSGGTGGVSMKPPNAGMGGLVLNFGGNYGGPPNPNNCVPKLIGQVRDFNSALSGINPHPDFEAYVGTGITQGLVMSLLGADGAPSYADPQPLGSVQISFLSTFRDWYSLTHPANAVFELDLDNPPPSAGLSKTVEPTGATTYQSTAFFPIDGQGTQAQDHVYTDGQVAHNYHFTFELNVKFIFRPGQVISFLGDDDLWVFIDKTLAVDVGGVHSQETGQVSLDTLGLTAGKEYNLSFFYAERRAPSSTFKLTSNLTFSNCERIFR